MSNGQFPTSVIFCWVINCIKTLWFQRQLFYLLSILEASNLSWAQLGSFSAGLTWGHWCAYSDRVAKLKLNTCITFWRLVVAGRWATLILRETSPGFVTWTSQILRKWHWKQQGLLRVILKTFLTPLLSCSVGQSRLQDQPRSKVVKKLYPSLLTSCQSMCREGWEESVTIILQSTVLTLNHATVMNS